jgi:putative transposase
MDERYLLATVRYTELNPVKARLCQKPEDWRCSSARAHLLGRDDVVTTVRPMLEQISDWRRYLSGNSSAEELEGIRRSSTTGRPAGDAAFLDKLEALTGRNLKKRKPGPKPAIK